MVLCRGLGLSFCPSPTARAGMVPTIRVGLLVAALLVGMGGIWAVMRAMCAHQRLAGRDALPTAVEPAREEFIGDILCPHDRQRLGGTWGASMTLHEGTYYLFFSVIAGHCSLADWEPNSQIYRAQASSPRGPFCNASLVLDTFAHNPSVAYDPKRRMYALLNIGRPTAQRACTGSDNPSDANGMATKVSTWLGLRDDPTGEWTLRVAPTPLGPWKVVSNSRIVPRTGCWREWVSDPALHIAADGEYFIAYKGLDTTLRTTARIGMVRAACIDCMYVDAFGEDPLFQAPLEDPMLYEDAGGTMRMLMHAYSEADPVFATWTASLHDDEWALARTHRRAPFVKRQRPSYRYGVLLGAVLDSSSTLTRTVAWAA